MAKKFLTGLTLVNLDSDPLVGSEGELYFNTSASIAKIYKSGSWSEIGAGSGNITTVSTTAPISPNTGDAWYKNDVGEYYVYDGTYWVEVNGTVNSDYESIRDNIATMFTHSNHTNVTATYDDANDEIILNTSASITNIDSIVYPDYIVFDTTPENTSASVGTLAWDTGENNLSLQLTENSNIGIGQELIVLCTNGEETTLNKGEVVRLAGAQGQRPLILRAYNLNDDGSALTIGIVNENIAAGAEGFVVTQGIIRNINTNGFNEGDTLYLSSSAGVLTNIKPQAPEHLVIVGVVAKKNSASGRIYVKPINGFELDELHNVLINGASDNQGLVYNSSASLWQNESLVNSLSGTANEVNVSASVGNITIGLPDDVTIGNDLTVLGNLTVSGSTTTLNVENLLIEDNIITLNSNVSGSPSINAGVEIERGSSDNVQIRWNEDTDKWQYTNDGTNYLNFGDVDGGAP